jgi:hypothetical protein
MSCDDEVSISVSLSWPFNENALEDEFYTVHEDNDVALMIRFHPNELLLTIFSSSTLVSH